MSLAIQQFFLGFKSLFTGFGLIFKSSHVRGLILILSLIYLVFFGLGLWLGGAAITAAVGWVESLAVSWGLWNTASSVIVYVLGWFIYITALIYIIFLLARVIASPVYALMVERILRSSGLLKEVPTLTAWIRITVKMTGISALESICFAVLGIFLLIFSFVPGLNIISAFALLLIMSFDSVDYSFEALQMGFRDRFSFFKKYIFIYLGLASAIGLTLMVPGLNLFVFPCAVAGSAQILNQVIKVRS